MKITQAVLDSIDASVLCWLATVDRQGLPNVSPKEVFAAYEDKLIIANIASPISVKNIGEHDQVCVCFIDILVQKGHQLKGTAEVITKQDERYHNYEQTLLKLTEGKYPIQSIMCVTVEYIKEIIAPSYLLDPDTTEESQIRKAKEIYGL